MLLKIFSLTAIIIGLPFIMAAFAWAVMMFIGYFVWVLDLFFKNKR